MALDEYLWEAAGRPFRWGEWDCCQGLISEWVRLRRGVDPAAPWRGRYSTELGCARIVRRAGGLASLLGSALDVVGLERTDHPYVGDVGAVLMQTARGPSPCGAIRTGVGWACLAPRGLLVARAEPLACWRV